MSAAEIVGISIYIGAAVTIALVSVFVMGLALHAENRLGRYLLPSMLLVIVLGISISSILSGRNLNFMDLDPSGRSAGAHSMIMGTPYAATWPLRFATLYILAASAALIVAYVYRRQFLGGARLTLAITFVIFFVTNTILPAIFGTKPDFALNHYYPLVVFLAAFAVSAHSPHALIDAAKAALLILLVGSLALAILYPGLVLQRPYVYGWVPGMNFRLWGLASHANSIGPLALLYLLLALHRPYGRRWCHWLGLALAAGVLVLAQSKTAWLGALLLLGILASYGVAPAVKRAWSGGRIDFQIMLIAVTAIASAVALLGFVTVTDVGQAWGRFARSNTGEQVFSLTGRGQIWEVAMEVWRANPLFGYGPSLWDPEFRQSIGMSFAFSAHNQFLQSLAGAGTMGLVGLTLYLLVMLKRAISLASVTRGLSLALGLFLVIRCMTETPLSTTTLFNGDLLTHLLIFGLFTRDWAARKANERRRAGAPSYIPTPTSQVKA